MMRLNDHLYIAGTIIFTVFSQLVMRWQVAQAGALPIDLIGKMQFIAQLFTNPWILVSILATLFAGISWMLAMSRFEISYAYPWIGLNFVLMMLFGALLFGEPINFEKFLGTAFVIAGVILIAQG